MEKVSYFVEQTFYFNKNKNYLFIEYNPLIYRT